MAKNVASSLKKWIILFVVLVVLVAGSVIGTLLLAKKFDVNLNMASAASTTAEPAPAPPPAAPIFLPLDPFTVTLKTETRGRILYTGITVRVQDEHSRTILLDYMPEVRDRILRLLATQNVDYIQTPEGRAALVASLSAELQKPYSPLPKGPKVTDVLFTAFVIQ
jgi:flagellar FliL protein